MQSDQLPETIFTPPKHPTQYRCLGVVKGIYKPSEKIRFGTFVFETGETYQCRLINGKTADRIRSEEPHTQGQSKVYRTWVSTSPEGAVKSFQILNLNFDPDLDSPVNIFNLRGVIAQIDKEEKTVKIAIARNETPPPGKEEEREWQPFLVKLEGSLPESAKVNQFWDIYAHWHKRGKLAIAKASYIGEQSVPKSVIIQTEDEEKGKTEDQEKGKTAKSNTDTEAVQTTVGERKKSLQIVKINKPSVNKPEPEIEQSQSEPKKPTAGRLEVTVKINTFPDNVKTLSNKSQQFDVDCDGQIVRITVKPKLWKKIEQAQEQYPMWMAAIAGKIGKAIDNGFELDQPAIQAFEIEPKNPSA